ncbi:ABC transporter permease [Microbacterium amylolyticum]|uniref:ABC transporter permease n=1 Tax=Microbacterium amylolyticum TaxID=936337 RepID=UPI003620F406
MTFGAPVASSVVEEKATRIVEILLSAIPARALLAGKVLGNTVIAMSQILLLVVAVAIGLIATGKRMCSQPSAPRYCGSPRSSCSASF